MGMPKLGSPLIVLVIAVASGSCSSPSGDTSGPPGLTPVKGAYFGTHFSASLPDRRARIRQLERDLGLPFTIDHVYYRWDDKFPAKYDRWTLSRGRMLFVNWTTHTDMGPPVKFSDITSGDLDDVIDARARNVAALDERVLIGFAHEPGALIGVGGSKSGTESEYVEAWQHVVSRFDAAGASNVSWVWTLTAFEFTSGDPVRFYPGDDVVDWVGVDGYVNIKCPWLNVPWSSWTNVFGAANDFAVSRGKPLIVAEFGLREDPDHRERKADWLRASIGEIARMKSLKAVVSFNSEADCASYLVTSPAALRAYREMSQSLRSSAGVRRGGQ